MRNSATLYACAVITALSAAACGGGGETGAAGGGTGGSGGNTGGGGVQTQSCDGQPEQLDLAGTWAAYGALTVTIEGAPGSLVSICPPDQEGQAFLTLLVTVEQNAADPTQLENVKAILCAVDLPSVTAVAGTCEPGTEAAVTTQIVVPDALLDAFPGLTTASVGGTLADTKAGADVTLERFVVTAGSSKTGAALPSWDTQAAGCDSPDLGHTNLCEPMCVADCAGLDDDDTDTFPGVTLGVCGRAQGEEGKPCNIDKPTDPGVTIQGRAFAALEVDPQFMGVAKSSCELDGTVDTGVRYTVVGADVTLSGSPIPVSSAIEALPSLIVKPDQSKLTLVRVDGKYSTLDLMLDPSDPLASCKTIIEKRNEIF